MQIHALTTGTVQIKTAMEIGRPPIRLLTALLGREYTGALPIHAWVVDHPDGAILIDTGELASSRNMPIATFQVQRDDEIDRQLERLGVTPKTVVLTHLHGDHMNGAQRLNGMPLLVHDDALTYFGRRMLTTRGLTATPFALDDGPFGAFPRSNNLTPDGSIVAVATPGHATGHVAIVVVEDDRHVLIAGDTAYTMGQLLARKIDGVSISARDAAASQGTILEHARRHPTVYLPSHDPGSAARLDARTVLEV